MAHRAAESRWARQAHLWLQFHREEAMTKAREMVEALNVMVRSWHAAKR